MTRKSASPTLMLVDRDLALFQFAHDYGGVTAEILRERFFPSPGARSACYTRIGKLIAAHYLAVQRLPSASGIGSGPLFLTVGPRARPVLAKILNCSLASLRRATRM